jgi:hypothetical protein
MIASSSNLTAQRLAHPDEVIERVRQSRTVLVGQTKNLVAGSLQLGGSGNDIRLDVSFMYGPPTSIARC